MIAIGADWTQTNREYSTWAWLAQDWNPKWFLCEWNDAIMAIVGLLRISWASMASTWFTGNSYMLQASTMTTMVSNAKLKMHKWYVPRRTIKESNDQKNRVSSWLYKFDNLLKQLLQESQWATTRTWHKNPSIHHQNNEPTSHFKITTAARSAATTTIMTMNQQECSNHELPSNQDITQ